MIALLSFFLQIIKKIVNLKTITIVLHYEKLTCENLGRGGYETVYQLLNL